MEHDKTQYYQNEGQAKDAKESMVVDSALAFAGAGLKIADDAVKLMDDAIEGAEAAFKSGAKVKFNNNDLPNSSPEIGAPHSKIRYGEDGKIVSLREFGK